MALRLIDLYLPASRGAAADEALAGHDVAGRWRLEVEGGQALLRVLVPADEAEPVMDALQRRYGAEEGFRLVLLPAEAALPSGADTIASPRSAAVQKGWRGGVRVSRAEIRDKMEDSSRLTPVFLVTVALSTALASMALLRDDLAVLIGAMVIAPLLGPNVALSFATTVGDRRLLGRALRSGLAGLGMALALSLAIGATWSVDPTVPAFAARTEAGLADVALALAAGVAGALAFTSGLSATVVGVMVAVALLPPTAAVGMLLGSGQPGPAAGAGLLLATNVICVNLAGVATFLAVGIRPLSWWEAERARRASRRALAAWLVLLAALLALLVG